MKAFRLTAVVVMGIAASAAANEVNWSLTGTSQVNPGDPVTWQAAVEVTGDNQGLAGYAYHIVVGQSPGPDAGADGIWGTADDTNVADVQLSVADFADSFAVTGATSPPGSLIDTGSAGGPGMNVLPQVGVNTLHNGELLQVGAGYLDWVAFPGGDGQTAGVGLESAKADLLADPQGNYVLNSGTIPTAGLAQGVYIATLVPVASRTLRSDLNFSSDQSGFIMQSASGIGSSFQFTVGTVEIPGDFNDDGFVDDLDLDFFIGCSNGPAVPHDTAIGCEEADFDDNGDVSSTDFGVLQGCFSGSEPGDPNCAD